MKIFVKLFAFFLPFFLPFTSKAQSGSYDVFVPIAKYVSQGDAEALSAWFAENLEISVVSKGETASSNQAKQILKSFFSSYTPQAFDITHTAGRKNMKYAVGTLNAGGENFLVTIFVRSKGDYFLIQEFRIERR